MLLEMIVQSAADARAADAGGADRLEVVRDIERDGLTPSIEVVRDIQSVTRLPLRVMVRESDRFSIQDAGELRRLQQAFAAFAALGVDGAVVGYARDGALDLEAMRAVLSAAPSLAVTLHRAFDSVGDPLAAIDAALTLPQVDRIRPTAAAASWDTRCARLQRYAVRAGARLTILAGSGVDERALQILASSRCVAEAHVGRAASDSPQSPRRRPSPPPPSGA